MREHGEHGSGPWLAETSSAISWEGRARGRVVWLEETWRTAVVANWGIKQRSRRVVGECAVWIVVHSHLSLQPRGLRRGR